MAGAVDDFLVGTEGPDFLDGLSGNDTLQGQAGNDLLYGGADQDLLQAADGKDQLYGGSGNDALYAGTGDDKLNAGSGDDLLYGEDGNDSLDGGDGNDLLEGGNGNDTLHGGFGDDVIRDLYGIVHSGAVAIFGDEGNDTLVAWTRGGGVISGGSGDDFIDASGDSDTQASNLILSGGDGNDILRSSSASADGGAGDDIVVLDRYIYSTEAGWAGPVEGGEGHDKFYLGTYYNRMDGDFTGVPYFDWSLVTGFEEIVLRNLDQNVGVHEPLVLTDANISSSGHLLVRTSGAEVFGDNVLSVDYLAMRTNSYDGSAVTTGHLTIIASGSLIGGALSDTLLGSGNLIGNGGDDFITGFGQYGQHDMLSGGSGNDFLAGQSGAASFFGGEGNDSVDAGIGDDDIDGGTGNDLIDAGDGSDTIRADAGDDTIDGAQGTDTAVYSGNMADYTLTFLTDRIVVAGPDGTDTLFFVNLIAFADQTYDVPTPGITLIGTGDPDYIDGTEGADSISGGAGNDTITGGDGNDTLSGGSGADNLDGGTGIDTVTYAEAESGVTVDLARGTGLGGDAPAPAPGTTLRLTGDRLSGIDNVTGSGFADILSGNGGRNGLSGAAGDDSLGGAGGNDILMGGSGADSLAGGAGADTLDGGSGTDTLFGGAGNDFYVITTAADQVVETLSLLDLTDAGGLDTVLASISFSLNASNGLRPVENLTLTGGANRTGTGNALNNVLTGNSGHNQLSGAGRHDTLNGGLGNDTLSGGLGADSFVFDTVLGGNVDRITDFDTTADVIRLENAVFVGLVRGDLGATAFATTAAAGSLDGSARMLYDLATGKLFFDGDGSGAGQKVLVAVLTAGLDLSAADFLVT